MPLNGAAFALQFLTILPPLIRRAPRAHELGVADAFFPGVGLLLGAALVGLDAGLAGLVAPGVRDVILVVALAILTGALHLDGVIDTFDGLFGARDPAGRLAVMRDPRAGAYGVVAVVGVLLLKVAALGALPLSARPAALLLGPCLGRWTIVLATWLFAYARPEGLGRAFKDAIRPWHVLVAGATALVASGWLLGPIGVSLFAAISGLAWAAGVAICRRLGGLTGDTYGGLCELTETLVWLTLGTSVVVAATTRGQP